MLAVTLMVTPLTKGGCSGVLCITFTSKIRTHTEKVTS